MQDPPKPKIHIFGDSVSHPKGEEAWQRATTVTGTGATHVKCFHGKLQGESVEYLDEQINNWLEAHPDYEVKLVTTTVGEFAGKLGKELHLILHVWV
jgi:hypothetical protein